MDDCDRYLDTLLNVDISDEEDMKRLWCITIENTSYQIETTSEYDFMNINYGANEIFLFKKSNSNHNVYYIIINNYILNIFYGEIYIYNMNSDIIEEFMKNPHDIMMKIINDKRHQRITRIKDLMKSTVKSARK